MERVSISKLSQIIYEYHFHPNSLVQNIFEIRKSVIFDRQNIFLNNLKEDKL